MALNFGSVNQQPSAGPSFISPSPGPGGGGGGGGQMDQQILALIMELFRRAQQSQTTPGPQATPPSLRAGNFLTGQGGAFTPAFPTQRTSPLGGLGNRQGIFSQTVQAPSERDQIAASLASALRNVTSARSRRNQGRP